MPRSVNDQIEQRKALADREQLELVRQGFTSGWASACRAYAKSGVPGELDLDAVAAWFKNASITSFRQTSTTD